ncbi:sodium:solute symporter [candidate division KSB1 bacterium]|nr:sodium:solute symporter [candidate division KSB1 bacterium]NIR69428.1 sodium:solute symporter [candidate division KSB1 bacterium]NIS22782.1 sodium:solute symporter [candidate division KSB1 bacterium]NIT69622.1 sodium:solute symporter [candidate division KSB1 bacterium]NIU23291.1 sodium:solute symporter [candidate division KSB1 bacterium]
MTILDYVIVVVYISGMVLVGLIMQRKASVGIDSYFLGNRNLPWWVLGSSGMASNLDVSGTMINTAFIFAMGVSGMFVEIRGGVTLIMAFLMIFQGKWNRRALVMTQAEWMHFRFGQERAGDAARLIAAFSNIVTTIAMITYFAIGSGKFIGEFLGIPAFAGFSSQFWAATLMIVLAMIYTVASGLYGVVWTDVFQGLLIFGTILFVCVLAFTKVTLPETFMVSVPRWDGSFQAIETTKEAWTNIIPPWKWNFDASTTYSIYNLFGIAIIFYLIKVTIEGSGGTNQYMIQRFFASRSDRESGLLSLFWTCLLAFRWPFIMSIAVMGIFLGTQQGVIEDPETVLPVVINQMVPIGIKGLLIAGLMAAAMSTFDSTVNAGAAYWVKDVYQAFINRNATEKQLMLHSRWSSIIIVLLGLLFTLTIRNINEIWGWITSSLGAGLLIPILMRWYWWRLNGYGFAAGTATGILAAIIQRAFFPDIPEYFSFISVTISSLLGMMVGTYATKPTDENTLFEFYKRTRPFGYWGPIRSKIAQPIMDKINQENRRDILSTFFAVPWQLVLFLTGMAIIMKTWDQFAWLLVILVALSTGLYFNWFRHLSTEVKVDEPEPRETVL